MTNPSRSASQGRLALVGSSARLVDSALHALKPATPISEMGLSAPPATITSASSSAIKRAASPMACAPVEQAVTTAWLGPFRPYLMLTCPLTKLISAPGIKKGDTRRGPFSFSNTAVSAIEFNPPMPDPIITPVRNRSSSLSGTQPESAIAWSAAATPYKMKSSILRCSLGGIYASPLKSPSPSPRGTSQA